MTTIWIQERLNLSINLDGRGGGWLAGEKKADENDDKKKDEISNDNEEEEVGNGDNTNKARGESG